MKQANAVLSGFGTTIFETMSLLAREHDAVNLGQGFPEALEPPQLIERAARELRDGPNQYPPMMGLPVLRQAIAGHAKRHYGLDMDWQSEVMVTSGATEALAAALFALIEPGDEVILLEPLYDSYLPIVRRAGGVPKLVRLEPPHWHLPAEALAAAFSEKTKLLLLNSPMNPSGKVFEPAELQLIADLAERWDAYVLCDEVYEHLVFDGKTHVPLMTLPKMRGRCLRIGSAGKIFSLTGWKIGWVMADAAILAPIAKAHQFLTFTSPPNLQAAVAFGLNECEDYYLGLPGQLQARRDALAAGLSEVGFGVLPCAGSYFLNADIRSLGFNGDDAEFCRHMTAKAKVAAIPVSAFYHSGDVRHYARFCFAKTDAAIAEALLRLRSFFAVSRA